MDNLKIWNALKQPPSQALTQIQGGRLRGKTDVNPQWRYKAMTEQFGPCGSGWKYEIAKQWTEPGPQGQALCFVDILLYVKDGDRWSDPIPGTGGSMLVELETGGLHASDEGYKMATTDALSVAMKMLGVAADVYAGLWDGTKYRGEPEPPLKTTTVKPFKPNPTGPDITLEQFKKGLKGIGYSDGDVERLVVRAGEKALRFDDALDRAIKGKLGE